MIQTIGNHFLFLSSIFLENENSQNSHSGINHLEKYSFAQEHGNRMI